MAKFDVHVWKENGFVLDCQADLLNDLNTRFVVPLLAEGDAPRPAERLNPIFIVEGRRVVMVTQFAAAVPQRDLGGVVGSLVSRQDDIGNALDMLISGF